MKKYEKIKMIAFDLDGTVLTSEKKITDYTTKILTSAIEKGIIVLPATGRPMTGIPKELKQFQGMRYAITANGARVIDMRDGRVMYEKPVPFKKARQVLDIFEQYDTLREIYYDGTGYIDEERARYADIYITEPVMAEYVRSTRVVVPDINEKFFQENRDVDKVQAFFTDLKERAQARARLEALEGLTVTESLGNNLEINADGVDKGAALIYLGETLGIGKEEMMAFGDGDNDREMIVGTGVGVAMANASQEIKEVADFITVSNDEDGVAVFIEEHVLA